MKIRTRLLSLFLVISVLSVLFAGCNEAESNGEPVETDPVVIETEPEAPVETDAPETDAPDVTTQPDMSETPDETDGEDVSTTAPEGEVSTGDVTEAVTGSVQTVAPVTTAATVKTTSAPKATVKTTTSSTAASKATTASTSAGKDSAKLTDVGGYKFLLRSDKYANLTYGKDKKTDAILDALKQVEKDLNCTITRTALADAYVGAQEITVAVLAGQRYADFVGTTLPQLMICAAKGYILPLNDPKLTAAGLNYNDSTRWFQPTTQACKVEGVPYGLAIVNDTDMFKPEFGHVLYFNTRLIREAGVADLYKVVREGNWTYSEFISLVEKISKDTNGDGTMDIWGSYGGANKNNKGWCFSNNSSITAYVNGKHVVNMDSPNTLEAITVLYDLMVVKKIHNCRFDGGSGPARTLMGDGKIGFLMGPWTYLAPGDSMLSGKDVIGLVPNPKGPKSKDYATYIVDPRVLGFMATVPAPDIPKAVAVMNAIAEKTNNDKWLDMYVSEGYVQDTGSLEMLQNYIFPKFVNDGHAVTELYGSSTDNAQIIIRECLNDTKTPAQSVATNKAKFQKVLDDTYGQ